jgi:hypothetical protein
MTNNHNIDPAAVLGIGVASLAPLGAAAVYKLRSSGTPPLSRPQDPEVNVCF